MQALNPPPAVNVFVLNLTNNKTTQRRGFRQSESFSTKKDDLQVSAFGVV